jgi:hypothetical protein
LEGNADLYASAAVPLGKEALVSIQGIEKRNISAATDNRIPTIQPKAEAVY